ncbi:MULTISPECIES: CesT family type III secretion system chaperone [Burkholderiaceae]|uniref:CesT family type III secretion system chaperone n=1 Tax=Burkholderiaceae TaxID=119060 RepID=UPI00095A58EC|nr:MULTISPECIES: CesT family type III secretion system chaperone [Burkholderiaceae]MCG1038064.1 CesT family type III secretion system chaperone [Mycetohabitans sp. B7]SIT75706.1 Tir chaperone protein (CesT) family protein [Burkholderia sp. b14]
MNHFFAVVHFQAKERVRRCLEALGQRHRIAGLTLDANNEAGIELAWGERLYLRFNAESNKLYIYAPFAPLNDAQDGQILADMLRLNCLEVGTRGGVISVSEPMDAFVYHLGLPAETLKPDALEQAIEKFIEERQRLAQRFRQIRQL